MQHKWSVIGCLTVVLSMAVGLAWSAPQDKQTPSADEANAYQAAHTEPDAQSKLKSLDDFVSNYPMSVLIPYVYQDYYLAYYQMKNYPQTIEYVDKLLALDDNIDVATSLQALGFRAKAYCVGSGNNALQAPEAHTRAKDAAAQGLQMLDRWLRPQNMTDEQFAAQRKNLGNFFSSVAEIADSHLKGNKSSVASCKPDPAQPSDPGKFDRIINQIGTEERQSPRVR
jgi:tetratricopeptide (TPR) repeat protein